MMFDFHRFVQSLGLKFAICVTSRGVCFHPIRAVGNMFSTLFWPIFPFFMQVAFTGYWVVSVVYPLPPATLCVRACMRVCTYLFHNFYLFLFFVLFSWLVRGGGRGRGRGGWGGGEREAMSCDCFVVRRFRSCLGGREGGY